MIPRIRRAAYRRAPARGSSGSGRMAVALAVGTALAIASLLAAHPIAPASTAALHRVDVRGFAFDPATITVAAGDTIVWTNRDFVPHTVTDVETRWDSDTLAAGAEWRLVARASGEYLCRLHPAMRGSIVVR